MVNYRIVDNSVIEVSTGHIIMEQISSSSKLKSTCRHLNFGGGFDGWTPRFFLEKS